MIYDDFWIGFALITYGLWLVRAALIDKKLTEIRRTEHWRNTKKRRTS